MRRDILSLGIIALLGVILGAGTLADAPVDPKDRAPVEVTIPEGASGKEIARILTEAGLLRSRVSFLARVVLSGSRGTLQAGRYRFTREERGREILARLKSGDALPGDRAVTIPEGFTLAEISERLARDGIVDAEAFRKAATVERFRGEFPFLMAVADGSLEGYLFPDTYRFFPGTTPDEVTRKFLRRFGEQFEKTSREVGGLHGRSLPDVVTMASIVEREVRGLEDRRLVAGILWDRLTHGVALEADATVRYAIGNWERPLTVDDLNVNSPYNTRKYAGLPPGPIGSPGAEGLRAALDPKTSDYFYYLSAKDGTTIFSKTLPEHQEAIQKHLR